MPRFMPIVFPALLLLGGTEQELLFAPTQGDAVITTYERDGELELESTNFTVDGQPHAGAPELELTLELVERSVFRDRYETVDDGRVTLLVRQYEEISARREETTTAHGNSQTKEYEAESELEGLNVVFEWDADEQEYEADFKNESGDSELLEGLRARLDFVEFLPDGEVEDGAEWEVPTSAYEQVFAPGGDLQLMVEGRSISEGGVQMTQSFEGDSRAVYSGTRRVDGVELQVLALEAELESNTERELEQGDASETQHNEYELAGELLWNTALGRFHSLELTGQVRSTLVTTSRVEISEQEFTTERTLELAGDVGLSFVSEDG